MSVIPACSQAENKKYRRINTKYVKKQDGDRYSTNVAKAECACAKRTGAAACESLWRDRPVGLTRAAVPVLFALALVTETKIGRIIMPNACAQQNSHPRHAELPTRHQLPILRPARALVR